MINKQDVINFVKDVKLDTLESAIVILTSDKDVCYYLEGNYARVTAAMVMVAKQDRDFKTFMEVALSFLKV